MSSPSIIVINMIIIIVISTDAPCRARTRNLFAKPSTTHDRASVATFRFRYDRNRRRRFSQRLPFPSSDPTNSVYLMTPDKKRLVIRENDFRVDLAHIKLRYEPGVRINLSADIKSIFTEMYNFTSVQNIKFLNRRKA